MQCTSARDKRTRLRSKYSALHGVMRQNRNVRNDQSRFCVVFQTWMNARRTTLDVITSATTRREAIAVTATQVTS